MEKKKDLSIIITSYKREKKLKKIIKILLDQISEDSKSEIIISGNKKYKKFAFAEKSNIKILYVHNKVNSNAKKRNSGFKIAKNKNIIFLDDDCLPQKNFIKDYLELFKNLGKKQIICGTVKYSNRISKKNNFLKYRESRHFFITKQEFDPKNKIGASKIVTMNMGIKKSKILKNLKLFDEKFGRYGFEDFEFGFRFIKNGFKLLPAYPMVLHMDERDFSQYLDKIRYMSKVSVNVLKKINKLAWHDTIYCKIENNFLFKLLLRYKIINYLIVKVQNLIIMIEKIPFLYLPTLIKFAIFLSYCRGYYDRKLNNSEKYFWYR